MRKRKISHCILVGGGGSSCVRFSIAKGQNEGERGGVRCVDWNQFVLCFPQTQHLTILYCNVATNTTAELKDLYYRFHHKLDVRCIIEVDLFGHHLEENFEVL